MKINEVNQPGQLNELALSSFIGDLGSAAIKSIFTGKGLKQQMVQDMFLKDFYEDAITSLDNGIKGGLVTTEVEGEPEDDAGDEQPPQGGAAPKPGAPAPTGAAPKPGAPAPTGAAPKPGAPAPTSISGSFTQKGTAPQAPVKPTSTNVKFNMPAAKPGAAAAPAAATSATTPAKPQAEQDWEARMKKQGLSPEEIERARGPYQARQNRQPLPAGGTTLKPSRPAMKPGDYKWSGGGIGPNTKLSDVGPVGKPKTKESTSYQRLNRIFESIVNINEQGNQQTISQFMTNWFSQYMQGVNWKSQEGLVNQMIKDIENSYGSDKGKGAIKKLAKTAFALSKSATGLPKGMEDELPKLQQQLKQPEAGATQQGGSLGPQSTSTAATPQLNIDQIILAVSKLSDKDLADLKKYVDELTAQKAKNTDSTQYMGKVAPNARPATKAASPFTAPTINPNKGTVTATGASKPGDITKGGAGLVRESSRLKKRKI